MTTIWRCSVFSVLKLERLRIHPVKQHVLSNDVEFHLQKQRFTIFPGTTSLNKNANKSAARLEKRKRGKQIISWYLLLSLAIILLAVIVKSSFPYPLHASCLVKWQFAERCDLVVCKLREQIETADDEMINDEDYYTIKATRVELKTNVTDDVLIVFAPSTDSGCIAMAQSAARNWYSIFDGGRNYCNLQELVDKAGYDLDDFIEETENAICTQYDMAHCG